MRRIVELHWPALLVGAACVGLALSIWASVPIAVAGAVALAAVVGALMLGSGARLVAVGVALAALGLAWGSLRMDALRESVLAADLGEAGVAELVTVAPARPSPWSTRVIAMTRAFRALAGSRARPPHPPRRPLAAARRNPGSDGPDRGAAWP